MGGRWLRVIISIGLISGYLVALARDWTSGQRAAVLSNGILLPASLAWLWLL
ncbi:MAG: hypothetical protein OWT27_00780 [Firmicutes bacterium]|nr:hypothetical protein [Bacillota bacterium]